MRLAKFGSLLLACLMVSAALANDDNPSGEAQPSFANESASLDQRIQEFLHKADRNGDGQLDQAEREAARHVLENRSHNLKDHFDKNDNGKLDSWEKAALEKAREQRQEIKERADRNHDGTVDKKERHDARNLAEQQAHDKSGLKADRNGDGHLSPKERAAAEKLRERKQQEARDEHKPDLKNSSPDRKYGYDLKQHKAPPLPNKNATSKDKPNAAQFKADMVKQFANKRTGGAGEQPNAHPEKNAKGGQGNDRPHNPGSGQVVQGGQGGSKGGSSGGRGAPRSGHR